jgi:hypothetical protein
MRLLWRGFDARRQVLRRLRQAGDGSGDIYLSGLWESSGAWTQVLHQLRQDLELNKP